MRLEAPTSPLKEARAQVDRPNWDGYSALHAACSLGQLPTIHALLSAGAEADLQARKDGFSPMHSACYWGHVEAARALLSAGARPDVRAKCGKMPLEFLPLGGQEINPEP